MQPRRTICCSIFVLVAILSFTEGQLFVISSLRSATSFIYRSGTPLRIATERDIWRICPTTQTTESCYPHLLKTSKCSAITQDCRCYNWYARETANVRARGHCVYVDIIPPINRNITLRWELDYTFPVLPAGYLEFLYILNKRLLTKKLNQDDYVVLVTPLVCERAQLQQALIPALDNCEFQLTIDLEFTTRVSGNFKIPTSIGRPILIIVSASVILFYCIATLRHPKRYKLE